MKPTPNQRKYLHTSALWAVFDSLTSTYIIAFSLLLGASNIMVGVLGAIPFIATFISELLGAKLTEYWGRVPIIVCTYAIDKFMWILIALVPFLTFKQPLIIVVLFYFKAYFFVTLRSQ